MGQRWQLVGATRSRARRQRGVAVHDRKKRIGVLIGFQQQQLSEMEAVQTSVSEGSSDGSGPDGTEDGTVDAFCDVEDGEYEEERLARSMLSHRSARWLLMIYSWVGFTELGWWAGVRG